MKTWIVSGLVAAGLAVGAFGIARYNRAGSGMVPATAAATAAAADGAMVAVEMPAALTPEQALGQTVFAAKCAACHGSRGDGRAGKGPPLIHRIYEPGHHGDGAFLMAARQGARAHHWKFGNMPPVEGLTNSDIGNIVAFVRAVQRENGIE